MALALALEQAGTRLAGWVDSCFSCLVPVGDDERYNHEQAMREYSYEREVRIWHNPPHLVSPMQLRITDFPVEQSGPYQPSLRSRAAESRDRISKMSIRASLSLKRRRPLTTARINGPSNFRRVESLLISNPEPFVPLELSIHSPGNRLSDLPNFEDFLADEARVRPIVPPPRALSLPQHPYSRFYRPGTSYQFPRKPLRSGPRHSSMGALDQGPDRRTLVTHPLIPHFSSRTPSIAVSENEDTSHLRSILNGESGTMSRGTQTPPTAYKTLSASTEVNRPLPILPTASLSASTRRRPPQTPEYSKSAPSSSKSRRSASLTTYSSTATTKYPSPSFYSAPTTPRSIASIDRDKDKGLPRPRSRRLSGSTLASSPSLSSHTTTTGSSGGFRKSFSLSSSVTARRSFQDPQEAETTALSRPYVPRSFTFPAPLDQRPYSTIYEGPLPQPQSPPLSQQRQDEKKYGYNNSNRFYSRHRESEIGLAF